MFLKDYFLVEISSDQSIESFKFTVAKLLLMRYNNKCFLFFFFCFSFYRNNPSRHTSSATKEGATCVCIKVVLCQQKVIIILR